jgi:hypothetical protein
MQLVKVNVLLVDRRKYSHWNGDQSKADMGRFEFSPHVA